MNIEILSDERVAELAEDYEVSKVKVYALHKELLQMINELDEEVGMLFLDPDFTDRVFELAVSIKSSTKPENNGGCGRYITDRGIITTVLYKCGIISFEDFANEALREKNTKKRS